MKQFINLDVCLKLMPAFFMIALSSCNNGSKGNNNNNNQNAQISGVVYGFQNIGTQSCSFVNNSSYSCSETSLNGQLLSTQIISFASQQELCNNLRNDNLHMVTSGMGQLTIATQVRWNYVNSNCTAYPNTIGNNGIIQNSTNLLRNMSCRMTVEAFDGAFGDTGEMQVPIVADGFSGEIFTHMVKHRSAWIFNITTSRSSRKYLTVKYSYTKAGNMNGDQLLLSASVNNGAFAQVVGFAGGDISLTIEGDGDVSRAEILCKVTDANNAGVQNSSTDFRCNVSGTDVVEKAPQVISIAELLNNSLTFTSEGATNTVTMMAEGSMTLRNGSAVYNAIYSRSSGSSVMNYTAKANLSTPSQFKFRRGSKSVDVRCK